MDLNNVYVADCESDGFLDTLTKIHTFGIGWKSGGKWSIKDTPNYENMKKVLSDPTKVCVFHNGYLFDKINYLGVDKTTIVFKFKTDKPVQLDKINFIKVDGFELHTFGDEHKWTIVSDDISVFLPKEYLLKEWKVY